jgi:membrane fusion protein, multidrug efflux system
MRNERRKAAGSPAKRKFLIPVFIVVALVFGGGIYWYIDYSKYISTDDAHIDGNTISLSSKILGRISHITVDEGDTVSPGQLLIQLDTTDLTAQKNQLVAARNQTTTQKDLAEAKFRYDQESITLLRINMERAQDDFERAKKQFAGNVISEEQYEHMEKAYEAEKAKFDASRAQLDLSRSQIIAAQAGIKSAEAQIGVTSSQLANTKIYAPGRAIVSRKWSLQGDIASPGQTILSLTLLDESWIAVYIEETNLAHLRVGQQSKITLDAYPGVTFLGHLSYIGSSTAAQFSLIPPNNASGNFTKVTQRILLKMHIDKTTDGATLDGFKFLPGMSAVVKIIKK